MSCSLVYFHSNNGWVFLETELFDTEQQITGEDVCDIRRRRGVLLGLCVNRVAMALL